MHTLIQTLGIRDLFTLEAFNKKRSQGFGSLNILFEANYSEIGGLTKK